jgi:hypothetical protein
VDSRQIFRKTFFGFHKKNEKGKQKVVFQGESIKKVVVLIPYKWGYVESKNRIRRSKLKVVKVVDVGKYCFAKSRCMGRVFPFLKVDTPL